MKNKGQFSIEKSITKYLLSITKRLTDVLLTYFLCQVRRILSASKIKRIDFFAQVSEIDFSDKYKKF